MPRPSESRPANQSRSRQEPDEGIAARSKSGKAEALLGNRRNSNFDVIEERRSENIAQKGGGCTRRDALAGRPKNSCTTFEKRHRLLEKPGEENKLARIGGPCPLQKPCTAASHEKKNGKKVLQTGFDTRGSERGRDRCCSTQYKRGVLGGSTSRSKKALAGYGNWKEPLEAQSNFLRAGNSERTDEDPMSLN